MFFLVVFQLKGTWEQDPHCRFHPTRESTCHGRDQSTDQQASHFSYHPKGIHRKATTVALWLEQKKGKDIRKAGGLEVWYFEIFSFPFYFQQFALWNILKILLLLITWREPWQVLRFRKKARIILWNSLAVFLRNNHLKNCWCREINKRAIAEWNGHSVHYEQTGVEGKPIYSWKLHSPSNTLLSVLGWKREPLSMARPLFSQHFSQWCI